MESLIEGVEAYFNLFYLKVGKTLLGPAFAADPKTFPKYKRVVVGITTFLLSCVAVIAVWCLSALVLQEF